MPMPVLMHYYAHPIYSNGTIDANAGVDVEQTSDVQLLVRMESSISYFVCYYFQVSKIDPKVGGIGATPGIWKW